MYTGTPFRNNTKSCKGCDEGCIVSITDEDILANGRICKEKVIAKYPSMAAPLESGMEWVVFYPEIELAMPELPLFLQDCGNVGHSTKNKVTKIQACLQIHTMAAFNFKSSQNCMWDAIALSVENSSPHLQGQAKFLCQYVEKWSGGEDPKLIQELDDWAKCLPKMQNVCSQTLSMLAGVPLTQYPDYIVGMVKAIMAAPDSFCAQGESKLINAADIKYISSVTGNKVV